MMKKLIIGGFAALGAVGLTGVLPPNAGADVVHDCDVEVMNHGEDTYTYCTVTGPSGSDRIVTVCLGSSGHCTTRNAG